MESAVAVFVQERFDLGGGFIPTLLEGGLAHVLRHRHVGSVEFAVADNLDLWDIGNLLPDQFEDRTAEVAGDTLVGLRSLEAVGQEGLVEPLTARGEAVHVGHGRCLSYSSLALGVGSSAA